jgi:L-lactate dehydrogenase complex protein LldG
MSGLQAKQNTLKKIREALSHSTPLPFPQSEGGQSPFEKFSDEGEVAFARNFAGLQGKFGFCGDLKEAAQSLQILFSERGWKKIFWEDADLLKKINVIQEHHADLAGCEAAVTSCECLIARTGGIVLSSHQGGRAASGYCPVHICVAYADQVVPDVKDALALMKKKYSGGLPSFISFATGPSRTADIEKTLVTGVHGPGEVFCFLIDKR